jgi:hypothetical protein
VSHSGNKIFIQTGVTKMAENKLTAAQTAALEKIKELIKEYAFTSKPSFLYTQKESLRIIEKDLCRLDADYIIKYQIPDEIIKALAKETYDALMGKHYYDKAILFAEHYKL